MAARRWGGGGDANDLKLIVVPDVQLCEYTKAIELCTLHE